MAVAPAAFVLASGDKNMVLDSSSGALIFFGASSDQPIPRILSTMLELRQAP